MKKQNIYQAMCDLSDAFFAMNGRKPMCMSELVIQEDNGLSVLEEEWAEAYSTLWELTVQMQQQHPVTYGEGGGVGAAPVVPDVAVAFTPTCKKSGTDFKLAPEAYNNTVYIETPNGVISIHYGTGANMTMIKLYDGNDASDLSVESDAEICLRKIMPKLPEGKWVRWADHDLGSNKYERYNHREFSVGCVSESTYDEMDPSEPMPSHYEPNVYQADDVSGIPQLFDMAGMVSAATKASGLGNCHFVFKLLPQKQ